MLLSVFERPTIINGKEYPDRSESYLMKFHNYLGFYYIVIPLFILLYKLNVEYIIPYYSWTTFSIVFLLQVVSVICFSALSIFLTKLTEALLKTWYRIPRWAGKDFMALMYCTTENRKKHLRRYINNKMPTGALGQDLADFKAIQYYFKMNGENKSIKELEQLLAKVEDSKDEMYIYEAYPYDFAVLKEYYFNLLFKLCRKPKFSLHHIFSTPHRRKQVESRIDYVTSGWYAPKRKEFKEAKKVDYFSKERRKFEIEEETARRVSPIWYRKTPLGQIVNKVDKVEEKSKAVAKTEPVKANFKSPVMTFDNFLENLQGELKFINTTKKMEKENV